jgi:hypothetical protein
MPITNISIPIRISLHSCTLFHIVLYLSYVLRTIIELDFREIIDFVFVRIKKVLNYFVSL